MSARGSTRSPRPALFPLLSLLAALALLTTAPGARADEPRSSEAMCDRECLIDYAERYLEAMVAHDPSMVPMAHDARFTENGQELRLPDGLWRIATGLRDYRIYVADPDRGQVGGFRVVEENEVPVILAFRLKVENLKITEMETIVIRERPGQFADPDTLQEPRPAFTETLPERERRSRDELIAIANTYFTALEENDGSIKPPFGDCIRIENGVQTSANPEMRNEDGSPSMMSYTCEEAFALGLYREDSRIRDRRWMIVDEERGLVFATAFFDHDSVLREYTLTDGTTRQVSRTDPWTWHIMELFKIIDGRIGPVEAVVGAVPYGMDSGWDEK